MLVIILLQVVLPFLIPIPKIFLYYENVLKYLYHFVICGVSQK